jgi:hypothetical protein
MCARWLVLSLVIAAAGSPRAFAQSASVQAQSLFDEGRKLAQAGKLAEACAAFESSQKLDPAITTLLNLADCREQNHQLATAWGAFVDANRMARTSNNTKLARVASNHARKLEPRLSKLTIDIPADRQVPGLEILRNKDRVDPAGWNHALPIDGGTYTITARAPGRAPWSVTRTIKVESDAQVVPIPKLTEARPGAPVAVSRAGSSSKGGVPPVPAAPAASAGGAPSVANAGAVRPAATPSASGPGSAPSPAAASSTSSPGRPVPPRAGVVDRAEPSAPSSRSVADTTPEPVTVPATTSLVDQPNPGPSRMLPLALGAGALVLGGAALGFKLSGDDIYDRAQASGDQTERDDLYHAANTRRYLAQGFGVAALGCAGAAVYLYVRGRGDDRAETTAITPVAAPQFAGLAIAGSW